MNDKINKILDDLRKTADNTILAVCSSQEELDKMPKYTANFLSINDRKAKILLDYITNLQQDNTMYAQLKDEYEEEIKDLQQENERLKMNIEAMKHNYNLLVTLIENGESITQKFENSLKGDNDE